MTIRRVGLGGITLGIGSVVDGVGLAGNICGGGYGCDYDCGRGQCERDR